MKCLMAILFGLGILVQSSNAQVPTAGLVAHYVFQGSAQDISGNGNDGTVNGAVPDTNMSGIPGGAYRVAGGTNIALPNAFKCSSMTFSAWVKSDQSTSSGTIFEEYVDETHCMALGQIHINDCIGLWLRNGAISFQWSIASPFGSAPKGTWHFVCFVVDSAADQVSLVIDSIQATPVQMNGFTPTSLSTLVHTTIGTAYYNPIDHFNGVIDDIHIYNRALADAEVRELFREGGWTDNINDGLIAYFPFNGDGNDASGYGHHGTVLGALPAADRFANQNSAYFFSNGTEVALPNVFKYSSMTFSAWIRTSAGSTSRQVFTIYEDATHCLALGQTWRNDNLYLWERYGGTDFRWVINSGTGTAPLQQWHHVAFTLDAGTDSASLYVDSVLRGHAKMSGYSPASFDTITHTSIGHAYYSSDQAQDAYDGAIDEVKIYNRALSHFEIQTILSVESSFARTIPIGCVLAQNYPNPFNPSTTIQYVLPRRSYVTLMVYNALGQEVAKLQDGEVERGNHVVHFDGSNLASGVYFYTMRAGAFVQTRKLVLVK